MAYCASDPEGQKLQANGWRWRSRRYYTWSSIWKTTQFLMGYSMWAAKDDSCILFKALVVRNIYVKGFESLSSSATYFVVFIKCGK